jgi:hypothetical protein
VSVEDCDLPASPFSMLSTSTDPETIFIDLLASTILSKFLAVTRSSFN